MQNVKGDVHEFLGKLIFTGNIKKLTGPKNSSRVHLGTEKVSFSKFEVIRVI